MNRNNFWRLVLVAMVLLWSLYELYPPSGRDLVEVFRDKAVSRGDTNFTAIIQKAVALQRKAPDKGYENLKEAIGTNDITKYFPFYEAKTEEQKTTFILNRLQREAAGRIKLGLDLQGGTSFLMEMDTNRLSEMDTNRMGNPSDTRAAALSQAVEVLRRRVDRFGVAEPLIQPEGRDFDPLCSEPFRAAQIEIQAGGRQRGGSAGFLPDASPGDYCSTLAGIASIMPTKRKA